MSIPNKQIGWSNESNLLWQIAKQVERLTAVTSTISGGDSYLKYVALLTYEPASAPVATVLENTLSGPIVWTRDSAGNYVGTLNGAFTEGKTACFYTHDGFNGSTGSSGAVRYDSNSVWVTFNDDNGTYIDSDGAPDSIEIRVYP
jgi:hypothetical protein